MPTSDGILHSEDYDWEYTKIVNFLNNSIKEHEEKRFIVYSFPTSFIYTLQYVLLRNNFRGNIFLEKFDYNKNYDFVVLSNIDYNSAKSFIQGSFENNNMGGKLDPEIHAYIFNNYMLSETISYPFENITLFFYKLKEN